MMLRIIIHVLFIIFLVKHANAQETATKNRKYTTWIKKTDKTRLIGRLYDVEDTKLRISNSFKAESSQFEYQDVYAHEIEKIKLRKEDQKKLGILIGLVTGFTIGYLTGKRGGDFFFGEAEKQVVSGILAGGFGAGMGAIVGGAIKIKIPINGSESKFRANLPGLKKYAYQR